MISTFRNFRSARIRRGTTTVESTMILGVFVVLLFGMLELSLALVRYTAICEAARRVARAAIVRGSMSVDDQWGPAAIELSAASNHPAASAARRVLLTLDPALVQIRLEWPDGSNEPDQRVQVEVDFKHEPLISLPGWYTDLDLQAVSRMRIAH